MAQPRGLRRSTTQDSSSRPELVRARLHEQVRADDDEDDRDEERLRHGWDEVDAQEELHERDEHDDARDDERERSIGREEEDGHETRGGAWRPAATPRT